MLAIIAYLIMMVVIGFQFSKTNNSADDFYLGGRKLGPFVTAMSAEASDMSSWLLMGLPGVAYIFGICDAFWTAFGLVLGTWINWLIVSKKIRRYSHKLDAITIPDFFSKRYGDEKNILTAIANLLRSHGIFPALIAGLILAGILAATMSTSDSQLLAASSAASQNILVDFLHVKLSGKAAVVAARTTVILISILSVYLAWDPNSSVFQIVSFAWAGFGAAFGPVVLLALFWRRSNLYGALSGMVAGGAMVFIWKYLVRPIGGVFNIYELLPAFIWALLVNIAVSLLTKKPSQKVLDTFDEVNQ